MKLRERVAWEISNIKASAGGQCCVQDDPCLKCIEDAENIMAEFTRHPDAEKA